MLRLGKALLPREHALAIAFFGQTSTSAAAAAAAAAAAVDDPNNTDAASSSSSVSSDPSMHIAAVCQPLYDELRPTLLSQQELTDLCEVVLIFRTEVLPDIIAGGPPSQPLEKIIYRLLQDAQERITFRVQTFVRDQIRTFKPSPEDIDYPRKRSSNGSSSSTQPADGAAAKGGGGGGGGGETTTWYITVSRALSCLAQLYRCVPRSVFEGLAQEILSECAESVSRAASILQGNKRSHLDGTLFAVSQLLTLREQIAPFDSDFAITHKQLDFSQTREAVKSLIGSRFAVGGVSGALELLSSGAPLLIKSHRDAKAALDQQLRSACEAFIEHASDAAARPLNDALSKATAANLAVGIAASKERLAASGGGDGGGGGAGAAPPPNKLDISAVAAAVAKAEAGVHGELSTAHELMTRYLPEPQTQEILFAPVRTNVLDALGQLETLLHAAGLTPSERNGCETERLTRLSAAVDAMGGSSTSTSSAAGQ